MQITEWKFTRTSVAVFKALTGISRQTLSIWRNKGASSSSLDNDKKMFLEWLVENEEDELKEFNLRMALGAQERLNVDHGRWEKKVVTRETNERNYISADAPIDLLAWKEGDAARTKGE